MLPPRGRTSSRTRYAVLGCVVAAIVLGILGMHALSLHASAPATSTHAIDGAHAVAASGHDLSAGTTGAHAVGTDGAGPESHHDHDLGHLVMLCAAMLAAAFFVLLLGRPGRRPWTAPRRPTGSAGLLGRARALATGPPPVWRFSIIRC